MVSRRAEKMGERGGLIGLLDSLRFHEASRQAIGLLLLLVCAWFITPAGTGRVWAGLALAGLGEIWRVYAAGVIHKNRQLATTGAYSLVRHPLYLGNIVILVGFTIASGHIAVIAIVIAFLAFYYPPAVRYEDAKLERLFGEAWRNWSAGTPAVFPTSLRWRPDTEAEWNARQSLLRNGELPISVYLVACAALLLYRVGMV